MGTELEKAIATDFGDVATKLRDRIKSAFVDLIPEERWNALLKAEVDKFMTDTQLYSNDGYGRRNEAGTKPSEFSQICQSHLKALVQEEMGKRFKEMSYEDVRSTVAQWIEKNHQAVLTDFVRNFFANGVQQISYTISTEVANRLQSFIQSHR